MSRATRGSKTTRRSTSKRDRRPRGKGGDSTYFRSKNPEGAENDNLPRLLPVGPCKDESRSSTPETRYVQVLTYRSPGPPVRRRLPRGGPASGDTRLGYGDSEHSSNWSHAPKDTLAIPFQSQCDTFEITGLEDWLSRGVRLRSRTSSPRNTRVVKETRSCPL